MLHLRVHLLKRFEIHLGYQIRWRNLSKHSRSVILGACIQSCRCIPWNWGHKMAPEDWTNFNDFLHAIISPDFRCSIFRLLKTRCHWMRSMSDTEEKKISHSISVSRTLQHLSEIQMNLSGHFISVLAEKGYATHSLEPGKKFRLVYDTAQIWTSCNRPWLQVNGRNSFSTCKF